MLTPKRADIEMPGGCPSGNDYPRGQSFPTVVPLTQNSLGKVCYHEITIIFCVPRNGKAWEVLIAYYCWINNSETQARDLDLSEEICESPGHQNIGGK